MKTMCGTVFALAIALLVGSDGDGAGPARGARNNRKRETVFTGVVTAVHHAKGKNRGTITVRGHQHARQGRKNQGVRANKGQARNKAVARNTGKARGKGQAQNRGQAHSMTFQVGPHTQIRHIKVGSHVAVVHHGNHADAVRVLNKNKSGNIGRAKKVRNNK